MKKLLLLIGLLTLTLAFNGCSDSTSATEESDITDGASDVTGGSEDADVSDDAEDSEDTDNSEEENDSTDNDNSEDEDNSEDTDNSEDKDDPEDTETSSLEDIIGKIYEQTGLEFPMLMNQPLTKENQAYMLGADTFDFIQGVASEPMMTSQAHSLVLFTVEDGVDIDAIMTDIKANVDGRKWICVGVDPENIVVDCVGNTIILIMDDRSDALHAAFVEIMG